ncbi:MAG: CotH kinase family protein [Saprospiraceae bacterium]
MRIQIFFYLILCGLLCNVQSNAQDFYTMDRIQEIKIYFNQPDWRKLLIEAADSPAESFTLANKISINGIVFDSVGAKFKGFSSFSPTNKKNPWHIELDHVKDQDYQGYKDIKLGNGFDDPTFLREALSYDLIGKYTDVPKSNFAKVWVNDTLMGFYSNTEAITKSFCKKHFYSSENNVFIKCTPPGEIGENISSLNYLGSDSSKYFKSYEMKSKSGWGQLIHLCDTLNNFPGEIEKILDVDRTLWMLAFNILFVNLDSYTGAFTQNYYLWRDENRQFIPIIWDLNLSFGAFGNTGYTRGPGFPGAELDSNSLARLDPYTHEANPTKPLISILLSNPRYRKMYRAHLMTMYREVFKSENYITRALEIQKIIDPFIKEDVHPFYTYDQFKQNLYFGLTHPGFDVGVPVGIISLMKQRIAYLDTLTDLKWPVPEISAVSAISAALQDTVWIKTSVSGLSGNGVFLGYRNKTSDFFTRIMMFDDGKHHDGNANDGLFAYGLKMSTPVIQYYIWAENNNAGVFSPARAEHEYYEVAAQPIAGDIVINELMASNTMTVKDPKGQYDDWIELYNKSNTSVDISGWFISDNPDKTNKWTFPKDTRIPGQGYLILWADEDSSQNTSTSFHTNFKLSASGETLILSKPDLTISDQVSFGIQKTDFSDARVPNGTGPFIISAPTFNMNNNQITSSKDIIAQYPVHIYPNPVSSHTFHILTSNDRSSRISVRNTLGQIIYQDYILKEKQINTNNWSSGVYIISLLNTSFKIVVP